VSAYTTLGRARGVFLLYNICVTIVEAVVQAPTPLNR